ncbi:ABC-type transport auxiliary lipoprotein family protein [Alcaligenes sp. Marseille-Q7550]
MISVVARRLALGAILGGAALLTACSVLPAPESLTYYQLPAAALAAQPSDPARQALILQVDRPYADRALASPRIIVLPDGNQLSAYQGVRWSDDAPTLLRNRLAGALRDAGQFRAVALDSDALVADWELSGSLNAFQVDYVQGAPRVRIQFDANLRDQRNGVLLQTRRFTLEEAVDGTAVPQVVQAFGRAGDALALEISRWLGSIPVRTGLR